MGFLCLFVDVALFQEVQGQGWNLMITLIIFSAFVTYGWWKKLILEPCLSIRSLGSETFWSESQHPALFLHFNEFICILVHHYLSMTHWCEMCHYNNMSAQQFWTWLLLSVLMLEEHERPSLHVVQEISKDCELGDSWIKCVWLEVSSHRMSRNPPQLQERSSVLDLWLSCRGGQAIFISLKKINKLKRTGKWPRTLQTPGKLKRLLQEKSSSPPNLPIWCFICYKTYH